MLDLVQTAQYHAAKCEQASWRADALPADSCDLVIRGSRRCLLQLSSYHAMKAFELSAQAAR